MKDNIRVATKSDFEFIREWLKKEHDEDGFGFYVNIDNTIDHHFFKKSLFVYLEQNDPVGFITGPLNGPDIMSIKKEFRRKKMGTALFDYLLELSKKNREPSLCVQCCPEESAAFWEKRGFRIIEEDQFVYGYKSLEICNSIPSGEPANVIIRFYPESVRWDSDIDCIQEVIPEAVITGDIVYLKKRVVFISKIHSFDGDVVVSVGVNNKTLYFDKAKYPEAEKLGIQQYDGTFILINWIMKRCPSNK